MKENWYALFLAIVKNKTVTNALRSLSIKPQRTQKNKLNLSESDIKVLEFLRKTNTWEELAVEFNVTGTYLSSIVKRKKATDGLVKAPLVANLDKSFKNSSISL